MTERERQEKSLLDALMEPEDDFAWKLAAGAVLTDLRDQTRRTNGRVTKLEKFMWAVGGGFVVIGAVVVPLFIHLVEHAG